MLRYKVTNCEAYHCVIFSSFLLSNPFLSVNSKKSVLETLSLCFNVVEQVSRPYKTTYKISFLCLHF